MITHRKLPFAHSNKAISSFFWTLLVKMASFFKLNFIVCSSMAFFSATSMIAPLAGAFGGVGLTLGVFGCGLGLKMLLSGLVSFTYVVYHIPGVFASFYLASKSPIIRLLVPIVCMIAFIAHPVGGAAWVYTLYWLIPLALYTYTSQNFFFQALGATLTAHAVGSVIYLYTDPMTPAVWLGLIPVVFIERLVCAAGMTLAYNLIRSYMTSSVTVSSLTGQRIAHGMRS